MHFIRAELLFASPNDTASDRLTLYVDQEKPTPYSIHFDRLRIDEHRTLLLDDAVWLCNATRAYNVEDAKVIRQAKLHLQDLLPQDLTGIVECYVVRNWNRQLQRLLGKDRMAWCS